MDSTKKVQSAEVISKDDRPLDSTWNMENLKSVTNGEVPPDEMRYFIRIMHAFNVPFDEYIHYQRTHDLGGTPTLAIEANYRAIRVERLTRKQESEFPQATAVCAESLERDNRGNVRKFSFYPENQPFDRSRIVIHAECGGGISDEHLSPRQRDEKRIYQDFLLKNIIENREGGYDLKRKGGIWHNMSAGQDTKLGLSEDLRNAANRLIKTSNKEIIDLPGDAEKVTLNIYQSAALHQLHRRAEIDEMELRHYADPRYEGEGFFKPLATFAFMTKVLDTIARERSRNRSAAIESLPGGKFGEASLSAQSEVGSLARDNDKGKSIETRGTEDSPPASLFSNETASSVGSLPSWGKGVEGKEFRPRRELDSVVAQPNVYIPKADSYKSRGGNSETGGMGAPSKEELLHQVRQLKVQQERQLIGELPGSIREPFKAYVFSSEPPATKIRELKKALAGKSSAVPRVDNDELLTCVLFCLENPPNEKLLQRTRQSMLQKEHQLAGTLSDSMRESFGGYVFSPDHPPAMKIEELKKALAGEPSAVPPVNNKELLECVLFRLENPPPPPPPPPPPNLRPPLPPHLRPSLPPHLSQPPPPPSQLRRLPHDTIRADPETHAQTTASETFIQSLPESDRRMQQALLEQITLNPSRPELFGKAGSSREPEPAFAREKAKESAAEREAARKSMEREEFALARVLPAEIGKQWSAFIDSHEAPRKKIQELKKALDGKPSKVPNVPNKRLLECALYRLEHPRSREVSPVKSGQGR